jgi:hypothetical protein
MPFSLPISDIPSSAAAGRVYVLGYRSPSFGKQTIRYRDTILNMCQVISPEAMVLLRHLLFLLQPLAHVRSILNDRLHFLQLPLPIQPQSDPSRDGNADILACSRLSSASARFCTARCCATHNSPCVLPNAVSPSNAGSSSCERMVLAMELRIVRAKACFDSSGLESDSPTVRKQYTSRMSWSYSLI